MAIKVKYTPNTRIIIIILIIIIIIIIIHLGWAQTKLSIDWERLW